MRWDEAVGENVEVELHDSRLVSVYTEGRALMIRLSPAWVHRSKGIPGVDKGTVWNQDAVLTLDEAHNLGGVADFFDASVADGEPHPDNAILDGSLATPSLVFENCIPTGTDVVGEVVLNLEFPRGTFRIATRRFRLDLVGEPGFIEEWPPG